MPKKRTSMSLDAETHRRGEARAEELGYESFSAYVEALIAADSDGRYSHYMVREDGVIRYGLTIRPEDEDLALAVARSVASEGIGPIADPPPVGG
jgi:hypothetical protein